VRISGGIAAAVFACGGLSTKGAAANGRYPASTQVVFSADPDLIVVRATVAKIACLVGSLLVAALGSTVLLVGRTSKR